MPGDEATFPAPDIVVVMVPMVAQGHLTQLYHLSGIISSYNIPVHFVSTTTCIHQVRSRHPTSAAATRLHFHELTVPPFTSPPPHPSIPFPTHLQPSFNSTLHLRHPTADLIRSLSLQVQRVVVIHDVLMSYVVQDVKTIPNAEAYLFQPLPAFYTSSSHWVKAGGPFPVNQELMRMLPSQDGISSPEFLNFLAVQRSHMNHVGELYDSSRVIEGKFVEYLEKEEVSGEKKIWVVGPFNPVRIACSAMGLMTRNKCLQWLDEQPANSVIYVSFGTTTTFSDEQIGELALGLERSRQRFIWVVRIADMGDSSELRVELPEGFEERVSGRGLIERSWAPQLEILEHSATGGFMSHCGWNSSMESISMGVPMATWPMHSDQPRNAFFITNILRIGIAVKNWEHRDELVVADVVAEVVKTLMASEQGEEMRRRAMKLGGEVKESVGEGGVSRMEMDSFISYVRRS